MVVETIFGLPGIGRYFVEGALNRDYTLVMGTVVVVAVFVLVFKCSWISSTRCSIPGCAMSEAVAQGRSLWADARDRSCAIVRRWRA